MNWGDPPIFETEIAGIPTGVTKDHNQVLYFWWKAQLESATLFHVDAHSDMQDNAEFVGDLTENLCLTGFDIDGFIIPAIYHGIINSFYWLNPHAEEGRLQDMGTTVMTDERRLWLEVSKSDWFDLKKYHSKMIFPEIGRKLSRTTLTEGRIISLDSVCIPNLSPLILDVDLDAFYCNKNVHNHPSAYYGASRSFKAGNTTLVGYERRIDETLEALSGLGRKPSLITITFSEGEGNGSPDNFVPTEKAQEVYELLTNGLKRIYR